VRTSCLRDRAWSGTNRRTPNWQSARASPSRPRLLCPAAAGAFLSGTNRPDSEFALLRKNSVSLPLSPHDSSAWSASVPLRPRHRAGLFLAIEAFKPQNSRDLPLVLARFILIPVSDHPCPASAGLSLSCRRNQPPRFLQAEPTTAIRIALARKEGMSFRKSITDPVLARLACHSA
jgi:hypothetical protein